MSWPKMSLLVGALVAIVACSAVFAPAGYTFYCLGTAWAACTALIFVLPLDRPR